MDFCKIGLLKVKGLSLLLCVVYKKIYCSLPVWGCFFVFLVLFCFGCFLFGLFHFNETDEVERL